MSLMKYRRKNAEIRGKRRIWKYENMRKLKISITDLFDKKRNRWQGAYWAIYRNERTCKK